MRFIDNKNGTITDTLTGLMWKQKPCDKPMTWKEAKEYCEKLNFISRDEEGSIVDFKGNWRLPTIKELLTLVDYYQSCQADWLNGQGFV